MNKNLILLLFLFSPWVPNELYGQVFFQNATDFSNINHTHVAPNLMGGGIAVIDYNNDGFEDLYFTGGVYEDHLYKNNGDKTFTDVSDLFDLYDKTRLVHTMGVISGDINNDGYDDLFISTEYGEKNILFLNQGGEYLVDIADEAGMKSTNWAMGASFGDYNMDGYLDIYVINYMKSPEPILDDDGEVIGFAHDCFPNKFYMNNGDNSFSEVSEELGVDNDGCGLAVAFSDVNGDSFPDIYVANDFGEWIEPNVFYQNQYPENIFSDNSQSSNLNVPLYGMGIGIGDVNNDGLFDYYISNLGKNALMIQNQDGYFDNVTEESGVSNQYVDEYNSTSWGTEIFDYNHDGFEDIFVSNGYIGAAPFLNTTQNDPNKLYKNDGNGRFIDVSEEEGMDDISIGRGAVTFDYDNDGDLDIVSSSVFSVRQDISGIQIYENIKGNEKNWLKVKLKGSNSNINGIGAKISCYFQNKIWIDEINGGSSHASNKSVFAHFGLNDISVLDSVQVIWAGGKSQSINQVATNQFLMFEEDSDNVNIIGCMDENNPYFNSKATLNSGCLTTKVITSVSNTDYSSTYEVYPNPIQSRFYLKTKSERRITVSILNLYGDEIHSVNVNSQQPIHVSHLKNGVYILKIDGKSFQKIIIKK